AHHCFDSSKLEDCRYVSYGDEIKDCMDSYAIVEKSELCYENFSTRLTSRSSFMIGSWDSNVNMRYSQYIAGGNDVFGCMGLRKKSYCIFNKQYSKEEYAWQVEKIVADMKERGEYGEFFPISISPFGYNETLAYDYYPMAKGIAVQKGYSWRDDMGGTFGKETIKIAELPDNIESVDDTMVDSILACAECGKNFRIIQRELNFYRALCVPLPRTCPDCRYYRRLSFRNPRTLFLRKCGCNPAGGRYKNSIAHFHGAESCPNEFETSYAPDRPEIIYCENCYNAEVA
ncbi:MAG: hypothetical protein AABY11_02135, partial [archaeon]